MRITILRGSGYCFHPIPDRDLYPEDGYLPRIESGRYVYNFRIIKANIFDVEKMAMGFNSIPYAVNVFPMGSNDSDKMTVEAEGKVCLTSIIPKENRKAVFRLYNPNDRTEKFKLKIGNNVVDGEISKREVLTVENENDKFKIRREITL